MKNCPACGRIYSESDINFCLEDGQVLVPMPPGSDARGPASARPTNFASDAPPTIAASRGFGSTGGPIKAFGQPQYPAPGFTGPTMIAPPNQTLPTVSLVLSILSVILVCCYGGIWLGAPAAVVGFLGLSNANRDPDHFSGRGLAIVGMVIGTVTFLFSLFLLLAAGIR